MIAATQGAPAVDTSTELALVDLSSIAYPIFLMSAAEPDPNAASTKIVDRIRALTSRHPHAAICCDSGRSFRAEIDPAYKAQRDAAPAPLLHQMALAKEQLAADGYPVWAVKGFEADDLIATATAKALACGGSVLVISADKDLLQLVGPAVRALSPGTNKAYDAAAVLAKFGVWPGQMGDYLALVGDAADNIIGAKGIGPKTAAKILTEHGNLANAYAAMARGIVPGLTPSLRASLTEFADRRETVQKLIALRSDVEIPFEEIATERAPRDAAPMEDEMSVADVIDIGERPPSIVADPLVVQAQRAVNAGDSAKIEKMGLSVAPSASRPVAAAESLAPAPVEFERQLEPRSLGQAMSLAQHMHTARMFQGYGSADAVLSTILAGRELGLQAIASLRCIFVVEGKHCPSADLLRALVLRSGHAKYFRCVERTDTAATFETQRGDEPPMSLRYTMDEAERAGLVKDKGGYKKNPADMLVARAGSKLARLVYPDVCAGLYSPDEIVRD